ncbi:MAG: hypothetical protein ABI577_17615 [bacterium]
MPQPDSVSRGQLRDILAALGFYQDRDNDFWFYNSDRNRLNGPSAVFVDLGAAVSLPLGIIRLYLIDRGVHPVRLDEAISRVLG